MLNTLVMAIYEAYLSIAPYLLIGLTFAGILHIFVGTEFITKFLGKKGFGSSVKAALLGVPMPLCSCGVIPTAFELKKSGASSGATVSFLISTPQTGIDNIVPTYAMLGPIFAIFKPLYALVSGVIGGVVTDLFTKNDKEIILVAPQSSCTSGCCSNDGEDSKPEKKRGKFSDFYHYAYIEFLDDLAPQLVVGIILAGLISIIPNSLFSYVEGSYWLQILVVLLIGTPLYVCDTSSLPIALALFAKGLLPGAIFVFLVVGPATNVATITLIAKSMGRKIITLYLTVITITGVIGGMIVNYIYKLTNFPTPKAIDGMSYHEEASWWMVILTIIFTFFFALSLAKYLKSKITNK
jgi:uncharacterized membrane protein YraQ (UPF0718 family)